MAFVQDRVKDIVARLDQAHASASLQLQTASNTSASTERRLEKLQLLIRRVSPKKYSSSSSFVGEAQRLHDILEEAQLLNVDQAGTPNSHVNHDDAASDLEWHLVANISAQTYGLVLEYLLRQTVSLNNELWYWNDVTASHRYLALYSLQTSPLRLYDWSASVWSEVRQRRNIVTEGWREFYGLVRTVIRERSLADMQRRVASPIALLQSQIRSKQATLVKAKSANASGIGYLLSNCFTDENGLHGIHMTNQKVNGQWKATAASAISSIDAVLDVAADLSVPIDSFENEVNGLVAADGVDRSAAAAELTNPAEAARRLRDVVANRIPAFATTYNNLMSENQRPSFVIRYWIPATALVLSSSTILRIFVRRRAEIVQWIRELGATTIDFWYNWVVEPTKKVIGTIRHDETSEVSLMSKSSLKGDRDSLERMVVDFAVDNPDGPALTETDIAQVRAKIQEGDLTPVLRAYEKELQSPLYSSLRGSLIRALLIQIQKTKVDVEVAMGGIDSLLKSQELVFGFVGLTPGILVCVGVFRWLSNLSTSRTMLSRSRKQSKSYMILRNIDRVLTGSPQADAGILSSREYGELVCEAVVLHDLAKAAFPRDAFREFLQDFNDLIDRHSGVGRQIRVADRIRWAYARWL